MWGSGVRWEPAAPGAEPGERTAPDRTVPDRTSLDGSRAARVLGWRPAYSVDQTVDDLARWYRVWGKRRAASATFAMDDIDGELMARYDAAVARLTVAVAAR